MIKSKGITPFKFYTSVALVELTGDNAKNLKELGDTIETIDNSSIYFHTHHYVREHHFFSEEYPSDFAYWVAEVLQEKPLGEKLAVLDLRDFPTMHSLKNNILELIRDYLNRGVRIVDVHPGLEFHFCRTTSVIISTPYQASNLGEFRKCIEKVDLHSLYYHLMEYRIRECEESNDFSKWIRGNLGNEGLAKAIEDLDPYFYPLEQTKEKILKILARERYFERVKHRLSSYAASTEVGKFLKGKRAFNRLKSGFQKMIGGE